MNLSSLKDHSARSLEETLQRVGEQARDASRVLALASSAQKSEALRISARAVRRQSSVILEANEQDRIFATQQGSSAAFLDRLMLTPARLEGIAASLEAIADQPDPIGAVLAEWQRPNGLSFQKIRVPLGVIGIIYEARPNVTTDAGALCLKSGNAAVLRCGQDSFASSHALLACLHEGLQAVGLPLESVQLLDTKDRAAVGAMLKLNGLIDVIIPRGGRSLIERVARESTIPVIKHLDGICHTYLDATADPVKALNVTVNAKMRRTGVCGATETLLVHRAFMGEGLRAVFAGLREKGCELRGDEAIRAFDPAVSAASEDDWGTEYLDAILSVKVVDSVEEAIAHINHYGSHHTDAIITEDAAAAQQFKREVDSGIVLLNTSTQFADGGEFGFGAEIGISTDKLHARGPVGAEHLTTTKYWVISEGAVRA